METFSALLAVCARNSPVTSEFPAQRPVTRSFDVFFDLRLNERLSKQWWGWWFETPSHPLWRHCNILHNAWQCNWHVLYKIPKRFRNSNYRYWWTSFYFKTYSNHIFSYGSRPVQSMRWQWASRAKEGTRRSAGPVTWKLNSKMGRLLQKWICRTRTLTEMPERRPQWHMTMVSCQKGPTRHAYAWPIGPFWQDTLDDRILYNPKVVLAYWHIKPSHHHHYADFFQSIEQMECLSSIFCQLCIYDVVYSCHFLLCKLWDCAISTDPIICYDW